MPAGNLFVSFIYIKIKNIDRIISRGTREGAIYYVFT